MPAAAPPTDPHSQTAFPVLLQVCSEGLCWGVNIAELRFRERSFLSTKWIAQGEKKRKRSRKGCIHFSEWCFCLSTPLACTMDMLYLEESKIQLSLWHWWYLLHRPFSPHCSYVCMVFAVQPSSVSAHFLITICWAIKHEWSLWPEDFYTSVQDLRAFENVRCCANNSNIISGIRCHLINVRKLSIASMIYGCENTEWFVE